MRLLRAAGAAGFGTAVALRNRAYDRGWRNVRVAPGPVISVGNVAMGGQGKTPLVARIAELFANAGARVAVLSRGYGRRSRGPVLVSDGAGPRVSADEGGDEPVMLAQRTSAVVLVDADRTRSVRVAFERHEVDVALLDDGFQHRRLARDLDIVVLGEAPPPLFPNGTGREPAVALRRCDLVVVTADGVEVPYERPSVQARIVPTALVDVRGAVAQAVETLRGRSVALLSGMARPERFLAAVEGLGACVVHVEARPDHARIGTRAMAAFSARAGALGAEIRLTTDKDAARWGEVAEGLQVLRVGLEISDEHERWLRDALEAATGVSLRGVPAFREPRPGSS